jgi:hypothetical protein
VRRIACGLLVVLLGVVVAVSAAAVPAAHRRKPASAPTWTSRQVLGDKGDTAADGAVSCPSSGFCAAMDGNGSAVTYDGIGWTVPRMIDRDGETGSVSCLSAQFCEAVDGTDAIKYSRGGWARPQDVDSTSGGGSGLRSVSCPTTEFCAAVDDSGTVLTYDGTTWSEAHDVSENYHDDLGGFQAVSCASAKFCAAIEATPPPDVTRDSPPVREDVVIYNGRVWGKPIAIDRKGADLQAVSCPTSDFCAVVDTSGAVVIYNGKRWSAATEIDHGGPESISCPSDRFCVVVDGHGHVVTYGGKSWSRSPTIDPVGVASVSCPPKSFCVALDDHGNALVSRDPAR